AGAFQQTISNTNGCDSTHTITVSLLPAPQNTQESRQICPGDSILVFGNYVTSAGVFQQTASNVNGCDSTHTVEVSVVPASLPELAVTQPGCLDSLGEVTLSGWTTSFTTSLDGVHFGSDTVFQHLLPGSYHLYIEQAGCEDTISFELYAVVAPMVYLPADTVIVAGSSVLLQPAFPAGSAYLFEWSPAQYLSCITCPMPVSTPAESVVYSLVVTDNSGCTATDEIAINVRQSSVYAPNVFRPEANGANAFFTLYADPLWVEKIEHLQVFDRWGDAVFERRNFLPNVPEQGWNGLFRGRNAPAGIYAWHARIVYADGSVEDRTGDVLLLR
ncbi:MAG TPA: gliding motility-associated C-terminal domain-containing protein, partial [Saprospiraceae bacterium]|nr:gliding motility-associated C-terminal domain-containing protein [Saprospiraceae bacterium]